MDDLVAPKDISQFVGNRLGVCSLRKWLKGIVENPKTPKRVCFLTGPVGSGKSALARLVLKEFGFTIREFSSSDLRTKPARDMLIQTMGFRDVLALLGKFSSISARKEEKKEEKSERKEPRKEFRKAVLVDDFENMGLATQEMYRNIRALFKSKKTVGVPVIFTGNRVFRGKKPLSGNSVFIHLKMRSVNENHTLVKHFLKMLLKKHPDSSALLKIQKSIKEQMSLAKGCGGDIRRVLKHLEYISGETKTGAGLSMEMEIHEARGPLHSLYRVINLSKERSIDEVYRDLTIEGMTVPFGIHWCYLNYVPWVVLRSRRPGSRKCCSELWRDISRNLADYGMILDAERASQFWGMREVGTLIAGWGSRTCLQKALKTDYPKDEPGKSVRFQGRDFWWLDVEKGKRQGDSAVQTPCMNKTLRGALHAHQLQNLSFQMLVQGTGNSRSWKPGTCRRTIELLRLRSPDFKGKERLVKLTSVVDKASKN
jgi:nucleoside-triphosphatase THEP1